MQQELTLEDKRKFLRVIGVQGMLDKPVSNVPPLTGGFAGCCGSMFVNKGVPNPYLAEYTQRIFWRGDKEVPAIYRENHESLLIPDVKGNVLVEWEDT